MKQPKLIGYLAAWLLYILFSLMAYPDFKITVMLFSIPLTMLGGWLYTYKGALFTTLLTIPYHYFMLHFHSVAPDVQIEAFNPFGIGTQLCFSLGTALLKSTQLRYLNLNNELENIITERTKNLSQLTGHLIEAKEMKIALTSTGLLHEPIKQLNDMLTSSMILVHDLEEAKHSGFDTAATIERLIRECTHNLNTIENHSFPDFREETTNSTSILNMIQQFDMIAGEGNLVTATGNWKEVDSETCRSLYPIIHEAITNALRHASPSRVTIRVESDFSRLIVSVENDGKSIPSNFNDGMGIPLMRYRARSIGASISFAKGTGGNTRLECVIPRNGG